MIALIYKKLIKRKVAKIEEFFFFYKIKFLLESKKIQKNDAIVQI